MKAADSGIETEIRFRMIIGNVGIFGPMPETAIASAPIEIARCFISVFRNFIVWVLFLFSIKVMAFWWLVFVFFL